jgi:hypothetical protein
MSGSAILYELEELEEDLNELKEENRKLKAAIIALIHNDTVGALDALRGSKSNLNGT